MTLTVFLSKALICLAAECFPVLIGHETPIGTFDLNIRYTSDVGYGGDVIQFHETHDTVFAIHRLWLLSPKQTRPKRLNSPSPDDNVITDGCINVAPDVYDRIKETLSQRIEIMP